jgi:hypothetical protein
MLVRQSTARTIIVGPILDEDGAAKTDEVVASVKIHKNGGVAAALDGSAILQHSQTGYYRLALTANDLDTLGTVELTLNSGTNSMPPRAVNVITADAWDALHATSGGKIRADVVLLDGKGVTVDPLGTTFPAVIASQASVDTIDGIVDAILEDTAALSGVVSMATEWGTMVVAGVFSGASLANAPSGGGDGVWSVGQRDTVLADAAAAKTASQTVETRLTAARAGNLDELAAANIPLDIDQIKEKMQDVEAAKLAAQAVQAKLPAGGANMAAAGEAISAASTLADYGDQNWATATSVAVSDKTGFKLAADGLDSIEDPDDLVGVPVTFTQKFRWLIQRFWKSSKSAAAIAVKTEAGVPITTQAISETGDDQELGAPS